MTATTLLIPVSVVVVAAPGWLLAWSRRRCPQVKSFDCAAEEAVRLVRPASSQWMGWE